MSRLCLTTWKTLPLRHRTYSIINQHSDQNLFDVNSESVKSIVRVWEASRVRCRGLTHTLENRNQRTIPNTSQHRDARNVVHEDWVSFLAFRIQTCG